MIVSVPGCRSIGLQVVLLKLGLWPSFTFINDKSLFLDSDVGALVLSF